MGTRMLRMGKDAEHRMISRARRLRRNMPDAEKKLWAELRGRRLAGLKFRRQHPIGPYIADFVCHDPKLVIELDGDQHGRKERSKDDAIRTEWLNAKGFKVLRFWNNDVIQTTDTVLETILLEANKLRR